MVLKLVKVVLSVAASLSIRKVACFAHPVNGPNVDKVEAKIEVKVEIEI